MTRLFVALAAALTLVTVAAGSSTAFPSRIDLPDGFQPEGIAIGGTRFFTGSIPSGAVFRGSLVTGKGARLVPAQNGRAAIGMKVDRGRLFVAGGPTGDGYVYDAKTGDTLATYDFASSSTFVNDVVVTKRAAWFTESMQAALYRVPLGPNGRPGSSFQKVDLASPFQLQAGFNTNGIDATPNGRLLVIVQSNTGKLFTVTPGGATREIVLDGGGESVPNGDGILLDGRTLYVVQNQLNQVAKIQLAPNLRSGRVVTRIGNADLVPPATFAVPTTIAEHGSRLYAVNARFGTPAAPTTEYWITRFPK